MQFIKLHSYEPVRQFILKHKEEDGILEAFVCERAKIRTEVSNATKKEFQQLLPKVENPETARPDGKFILNREKLINLATIYCVQTEDGPLVFDIHYHKNGHINGFRSEEEVKEDALAILKTAGYKVGLSVGAFMCNKKHTNRNTPQKRHHVKSYEKVG